MNFICQSNSLEQLKRLAEKDRHSVLIEGAPGCGKTYLARQYAGLLKVQDFHIVPAKVNEIRESVDLCSQLESSVVLCIENLDKGVVGSSYTLLKSLEEPPPNMYIVITCQNANRVPDTIVSRSTVISVSPPTSDDLDLFSRSINPEKYFKLSQNLIWRCVRTFADAQVMLSMSEEHINYILSLKDVCSFHDSISNIVWKIGHYEDKTETPIELVVRYIMEIVNTNHIRSCGIECISDLNLGRIAQHAVLSKFLFECKYCE